MGPLQSLAVEGLRRYGYSADADRISYEFLSTVAENFRREGTIREKYNVVTRSSEAHVSAGYQANVVGFGWTNGVFLELLQDLPKEMVDRLAKEQDGIAVYPSVNAGKFKYSAILSAVNGSRKRSVHGVEGPAGLLQRHRRCKVFSRALRGHQGERLASSVHDPRRRGPSTTQLMRFTHDAALGVVSCLLFTLLKLLGRFQFFFSVFIAAQVTVRLA